jgi:hypothetical protein
MYKHYIYSSAELGVTSLSFRYQQINDKNIHVKFVRLPTHETHSQNSTHTCCTAPTIPSNEEITHTQLYRSEWNSIKILLEAPETVGRWQQKTCIVGSAISMPAPRCNNCQTGKRGRKELRLRMQRTTKGSTEVHSLQQTWPQADKNCGVKLSVRSMVPSEKEEHISSQTNPTTLTISTLNDACLNHRYNNNNNNNNNNNGTSEPIRPDTIIVV